MKHVRIALLLGMLCGASLTFHAALALEPLPVPKPGDSLASDDGDGTSSHKAKKHNKKSEDDLLDDSKSSSDTSMTGDNRIKMLLYDESDVYTITTRYGYQTNIVFSPQEEIELISVGDRSLWQIIPSGHRMFIRPMEEDVVTNMTVLTNKHSYQFDLKSLPADKTGNIYVAQFVYQPTNKPLVNMSTTPPPGFAASMPPAPSVPASSPFGVGPSIPPAGQVTAAPQQPTPLGVQSVPMTHSTPEAVLSPAVSPTPNYSYTYSGPDQLAPLQVYDDGRATYLKYGPGSQLPAGVFIVDPSGRETPVNYTMKDDYVVVDTVAGELSLRNNANTVHVFNEMLNPG